MNHHVSVIETVTDWFPKVNVAEMDIVDGAVGPGCRLGIWVQGCLKRCPGCINQSFLPLFPRKVLSVEALLTEVDSHPHLDGISLSGGEPVLQAQALIPFLQEIHRRNLTVVCYTGYRWEELTAPTAPVSLRKFLDEVDLLIDGEYQADLPRGGLYCASSNQQKRFLTGRIQPTDLQGCPETTVELGLNQARTTGILPDAIYHKLVQRLSKHGVKLGPVE